MTSIPSSMRACTWKSNTGGLEANLKLDNNVPLPKNAGSVANGQTLVKVAYASLNPVDYKMAEMPILGNYILPSSIPGLDFSGTVVDTKLSHLKPGDRVHGRLDPPFFGTIADYVVVGKDGIAKVPDNLPLRDAAVAGIVALTAYQSIAPYVKAGDEVFINGGSGGTGTFGIQIAKALGCKVTTTCSGPNVDLCKQLGADEVINYRETDVLQTLKFRSSKPFRLIVDNVFTDGTLYWNSPYYLEPNGTFLTPGGTKFAQIKDIALGNLLPRWLGGGQAKFVFLACKPSPEQMATIDKWMAEGKVKAIIEQEYEMQDAGKAYERLKSGRVRGKLVVKVGGEK
ncbi:Zinc-type alcohol dehydrogenase-like protein C16A3.02c [Pseudocercospora fuligena]|uniref:Zinc-type alcohol dehydrogenase-like protein C16A3.02c n=1 Tax=Pseudocercospora fuligena TaxID=685502 RepID=A0A8H6RP54_9PEZI|nr:Zinc-type alcohol dehydrogenase-like protein C16A3.02c [Pseudocercospora fuligena]